MNPLRTIRWYVLFALALSLLVVGDSSLAQDPLGILVYPRRVSHNIAWSADSRLLVFYDMPDEVEFELPSVEASGPYWYRYDLETGELTSSAIWPLQPDLTADELALLDPNTNFQTGEPSFILTSPDECFLVYGQETPPATVPSIAISNREQVVPAGFKAIGLFNVPREFRLFWSADSQSFAASYYGPLNPSSIFTYVTGYDGGDSLLEPITIDAYFEIGDRSFNSFSLEDTVYDVSASGSQVLITILEAYPARGTPPVKLLIWEPLNPDNSLIIEDFDGSTIRAASFSPQGETALLLVNETGLVQYDMLTQTSTVLRDDITTRTVSDVSFSPDGRWLMVRNSDGIHLISVVDEVGQ